MFLVLEGQLPVPSPSEKRPSEAFLNSASKLANLPSEERERRLKVSVTDDMQGTDLHFKHFLLWKTSAYQGSSIYWNG